VTLEHELLELLGPLYDAAMDASLWEEFLVPCCRILGGTSANILMVDSVDVKSNVGAATGFEPAWIRAFDEYYSHRNVVVEAAAANGMFRTGELLVGDELVPRHEFEASEYFNDYLKVHDFHYILGGTIYQSASRFGVISIQKTRAAAAVSRHEAALLKALRPHLSRAQEIQWQVAELNFRNDLLTAAVDRLAAGLVLLDARSTPVLVNRAAERIFAARDGLALSRQAFEASTHEQTALLRRLIAGAIATGDGVGWDAGGAVRVARPSGNRDYHVVVTPLPPRRVRLGARTAAAAVFITDPEHRIETPAGALSSLFGLTPAEIALCGKLVNGLSVEEAAEELGISRNTARTHPARTFTKTGTTGQAELSRLLVRSTGLLAPITPDPRP